MKRFKNLLVLFAIAFAFVVASKAFGSDTMYVRADSGSAASISGAVINYADLTAEVVFKTRTTAQAYYQILKTATDEPKEKNWIPVYENYIDLSTVTKECYIAVTLDKTGKTSDITPVKVAADVKSVKMTFDYAVDCEDVESLEGVIGTIEITPTTGDKVTKKEDVLSAYTLQWKRGANGNWNPEEEFCTAYGMLRSSNGTLYVRALKGVEGEYTALPSKEAKVKVPKTAAAPKVKIDYKKGTVAIKNGMEFVYDDVTYYVPAYNKNASSSSGLMIFSGSGDPTETKTKISALTVSEIAKAINDKLETDISAGSGFSIEVRTSAVANKKYASYYATVNLAVPAAAPTVTATIADGKLTLSESGASTANLEYIYDTADKAATNLAKGSFKAYSKSLSYDSNKVLYVRTPGDADKSVFPSEYRQVTATEVFDVTFKVTVSATSGEETVDTTEAMKATVTVGTKDVTEDGTTVTKGETVTYTVTVPEVSGFTATLKVDGTAKTLTDNKAEIKSEAINAAKEFKIEVTYTKVTE